MKKKICAVSSCRNGQTYTSAKTKKLGLKNKSLFKAPKEEIMLHQWAQILKSFRKPLTENCFVCEDHFDEDDIIRFYECQLKDRTIHRLQRGKPELRKTAIPVATKILKPVDREINESNNQGSMDMHEENNLTQLCTSNNTCNIDYPHQDHQSLNPQSSTIIKYSI